MSTRCINETSCAWVCHYSFKNRLSYPHTNWMEWGKEIHCKTWKWTWEGGLCFSNYELYELVCRWLRWRCKNFILSSLDCIFMYGCRMLSSTFHNVFVQYHWNRNEVEKSKDSWKSSFIDVKWAVNFHCCCSRFFILKFKFKFLNLKFSPVAWSETKWKTFSISILKRSL